MNIKGIKWSKVACLIMGTALCIISILMQNAVRTWIEEEEIKGNKTTTTAIGAGIGAGVGAGIGVAIGGVGIAACGTGIGLPVGAVCLGLAALFGLAGAGVGNLAGDETQIVQTYHVEAIFPTWLWITVLLIGICLLFGALFSLYNDFRKNNANNNLVKTE